MKTVIAISVDNDLVKWIESQIKTKKFANRSHGIEYCIEFTKNNEK